MAIQHLFIDRAVAANPAVEAICRRIGAPAAIVDDISEVYRRITNEVEPIGAGKRHLLLTRNRGAFLRSCPGTRYYRCCDYRILHVGTFCVMDCSYCILQTYFHPPVLQFFVNHEDLFEELNGFFQEQPYIRRIGTGEYTDSLIWERWTDLNPGLVLRFAAQKRAVLELKTKTVAIDRLRHLDHNRKTILSWSLNTERIIASEERKTAPLAARLAAAARAASWGYPLAFHFDPMVIYPGCEDEYREVIRQLFALISARNVVWVSLGTFRYMPALKAVIQKRFPASKIIYGESIPGLDEKMRYFKPLRMALYQSVLSALREFAPEATAYFCMEDDEVWEQTFGYRPGDRGGLSVILDTAAARVCDLQGPIENPASHR